MTHIALVTTNFILVIDTLKTPIGKVLKKKKKKKQL